MKNLKREKGITLIALIITIVVLLIIAGVAIGTMQESNIIGHTKDAVSSYEEAKGKEDQELKDAETLLDKYALKDENNNIQYYTTTGYGGDAGPEEIVYALIKENENYALKVYIGELERRITF